VIKKPRGRGGHSPRWAAEPEKVNNNNNNNNNNGLKIISQTSSVRIASFTTSSV
jgi:hypothetical protein